MLFCRYSTKVARNKSSPSQEVSSSSSKANTCDIIAEWLEYRHGKDCHLYFERTTARFPQDPEGFQHLVKHERGNPLEDCRQGSRFSVHARAMFDPVETSRADTIPKRRQPGGWIRIRTHIRAMTTFLIEVDMNIVPLKAPLKEQSLGYGQITN
ncbi:MAG: hypothetical protein J3Q66DRAFT_429697 [Benniella sp.]|nr:MAG: hypothetical protein J3Q66DRAFT_429697 [Benniella sp.]